MKEIKSKRLILKWGNHKHRITISHDGHGDFPAPLTAAASALPLNLKARNRTVAPEMEENRAMDNEVIIKRSSRSTENKIKKELVDKENRNSIRSKMAKKKKKKEPMLKLAVSLSMSEIMDDFLKMTGKKPPSRPKKRTRAVQRDVNATYLGLSLAEIPSDRYDVPESLLNHSSNTNKVNGISDK